MGRTIGGMPALIDKLLICSRIYGKIIAAPLMRPKFSRLSANGVSPTHSNTPIILTSILTCTFFQTIAQQVLAA